MRARHVLAAALVSAAMALVAPAGAQESAVRFEISAVADSTFEFPAGRWVWVAPGLRGIAVDPRRRDALVARFRVLRVTDGVATALITGETTRLTTLHVALLEEPRARFYTRSLFWAGAAMGAVIGFVAGRL